MERNFRPEKPSSALQEIQRKLTAAPHELKLAMAALLSSLSLEVSAHEPTVESERLQDMTEFRATVLELVSSGNHVTLDHTLCQSTDADPNELFIRGSQLQAFRELTEGIGKQMGLTAIADPLEAVLLRVDELNLPPVLRERPNDISLPVYESRYEQIDRTHMAFVTDNYFTGQEASRVVVTLPDDYLQPVKIAPELIATVVEQLRTNFEELERTIYSDNTLIGIAQVEHPNVRKPSFELNPTTNKAERLTFLEPFSDVRISVYRPDDYFERSEDHQMRIHDVQVVELAVNDITVNGLLTEVRFGRKITTDNPAFTEWSNKPATEQFTDQFGNQIIVERFPISGLGLIEKVYVHIPFPFDTNPTHAVSIDLSPIGYATVHQFAIEPTLKPEHSINNGTYAVYNVHADKEHLATFYEQQAQVAQSITEVERLFGLKPGSAIKRIVIGESRRPNAAFSAACPDMLLIHDKAVDLKNLPAIVRHEAFHLLDFKYRLSERLDFSTIYDLMRGSHPNEATKTPVPTHLMLYDVSEAFWDNAQEGGHADENYQELFASLMNSLFHPNLEQRVQLLDHENQVAYHALLVTLEKVLINATQDTHLAIQEHEVDVPKLDPKAPIIAMVTKAKELAASIAYHK